MAEDVTTEEEKVEPTQEEKENVLKGLTEEQVTALLEKARKEEKDKLYPQLDEFKTSLKEVQEALRAEKEEKERIRKEAEETAEAERQAKLSADDRQLEVLKRLEEQLNAEREERKKLAESLDRKEREATLRAYRERAIAAAGEEIIPELVTGNTEAEIDAAVRNAKARYEELAKKFKVANGEQVRRDLSGGANPGLDALEEEELEKQINAVDQNKYNSDPKYREEVQRLLAHAYQSQGRL